MKTSKYNEHGSPGKTLCQGILGKLRVTSAKLGSTAETEA